MVFIGGIMLGLGRALGETMAVTFIIGNTYQLDSASLYMPGKQYHLCAGERICGSGIRSARCRTDGTGPDPVCDYLHRPRRIEVYDYAPG
ncbi:phosphate transporter permease subunit PstC [Escherichia coli]|uniref:Phosphate transporter permease subunit PstC n=1 Tax=Escherichia coli TaxID=562 RepID=A0A376L4L7_ECOLX|nr:phosphate transporter permease subunit PstC [Escherichia coli]